MEGLLSGREDDRVNVTFGPDPQSQAGDSSEHEVAVDKPCGIALGPNLPPCYQAGAGDSYSRTSRITSRDGTVGYEMLCSADSTRAPRINFDWPSHDSSDDDSHDSGTVRDLDLKWVTAFQEKLDHPVEPKLLRVSSEKTSCCIHRVPQCLLVSQEKKDYLPQVISIGPFHRGKEHLKAMEDHKLKYLYDFLSRNKNVGLVEYMKVVKRLEKKALNCYSECFSHLYSNEAFVEMMLVDGCFIIELLCKADKLYKANGNGNGIVAKSDPIFNLRWLLCTLQNDMLLLENQIPYCVLEELFSQMNSEPGDSLARLAVKFFENIVPKINKKNIDIMEKNPKVKPKHLLHLLHLNILPRGKMEEICDKTNKEKKKDEFNPSEMIHRIPKDLKMIHCITELCEAGIEFEKVEKDSFLEIGYSKGVITIPSIKIEDFTNSLLLNFIAFEQCYRKIGLHVTTYTIFMDCLINSAKDIEVLRHKDIVDNWLGNDDVVANFFNKLGRGVTISSQEFYLTDVFNDVLLYFGDRWHAWRATLMHNYFSNPWAIISVLAAIILGLLTLLQTIFSGMSL